MVSPERKTPVIIGVGDIVNRSKKVEDAIEPLQLILQAIAKAIVDTGLDSTAGSNLQSQIDSVDVVKTWTWPYPDLAGLVADGLSVKPKRTHNTDHGGNQPALLVDEAARRIASGQTNVAVVTGGEALASLSACAAAQKLPPPGWTHVDQDVASVFSPTTRELQPNLAARHGIGSPIHIYPLYENSFRAHRNQSIGDNHEESAQLYAEFAKVAEQHEYSWNYGRQAATKDDIARVDSKNRMICFPYPLLMNAFNTVNLAAACILTSTENARKLGIPSDKWIYPLGGAGTSEHPPYEFWKRGEYHWSPTISRSLDAGLKVSNLDKSQIDLYDFYSCFPIVPKLASHHLNLPITTQAKPITLLGGLTSFGGAGNNYSLHAITELTRLLRTPTPTPTTPSPPKTGLILANGGVLSYQHVLILSRSPRPDGLPYPHANPLPEHVTDIHVPTIIESVGAQHREAVVETYTVEYKRDGSPGKGFVILRLVGERKGRGGGERVLANTGDERALRELCSLDVEPIGRVGRVWSEGGAKGRNLFVFGREGDEAKL